MTDAEKKEAQDFIGQLTIDDITAITKDKRQAELVFVGLIKISNFLAAHGYGKPE